MKHKIASKKHYHETMVAVYNLINRGEVNLSTGELENLAVLQIDGNFLLEHA